MANLTYMPQGIPFSPQAMLTDAISETDTVIPVSDVSVFPDAPNYATLGTDDQAETVRYAAKADGILSGCTRGVEGEARAWQADTLIARNFTNADQVGLIENIKTLNETKAEVGALYGLLKAADGALAAAVAGTDYQAPLTAGTDYITPTTFDAHADDEDIHVTTADKNKWNNPPAAPVTSVFSRTGDITAQPGDYTPDQVGAAPELHASQHAADGTDPLTPSSIGAAAATHASTHAADGADPITPASIGAASTHHAATHASDGADPVSPASIGAATPPTTSSITLTAVGWTGSASPYTQPVTITGSTAKTKVDLQPNAAALAQLISDEVAGMYIENNNGTLTAYAVGAKPSVNLTMQVTLTEIGG